MVVLFVASQMRQIALILIKYNYNLAQLNLTLILQNLQLAIGKFSNHFSVFRLMMGCVKE